MVRMLLFAAAALAPSGATLANTYQCGEWSIAPYQEAGEFTVTLTDNALFWSNGQTAISADKVHTTPGFTMFWAADRLYFVPGPSPVRGDFGDHFRIWRVEPDRPTGALRADCYRAEG